MMRKQLGGVNPAFLIAVLAMGFVVYAFTKSANPYVNFAEAKMTQDDRVHVAGDIIDGTIKQDRVDHSLTFTMKDKAGTVCTVTHKGEMPGNLSEAKQVVVVGHMQGDTFLSQQMLVKCPSKYEEGKAKNDKKSS